MERARRFCVGRVSLAANELKQYTPRCDIRVNRLP